MNKIKCTRGNTLRIEIDDSVNDLSHVLQCRYFILSDCRVSPVVNVPISSSCGAYIFVIFSKMISDLRLLQRLGRQYNRQFLTNVGEYFKTTATQECFRALILLLQYHPSLGNVIACLFEFRFEAQHCVTSTVGTTSSWPTGTTFKKTRLGLIASRTGFGPYSWFRK